MKYLKTFETVRDWNEEKFTRWFTGSKIINSAGKPLLVYHTSKEKIEELLPTENMEHIRNGKIYSRSGKSGMYFTDDNVYTIPTKDKPYGNHAHAAYLNIQNPFNGTEENIVKFYKEHSNPLAEQDGMEDWAEQRTEDFIWSNTYERNFVIETAKRLTYDGMIIYDDPNPNPDKFKIPSGYLYLTSYVAFYPEKQVWVSNITDLST